MTYKALVIEDDPEVLSAIEDVLDSIGHQFDVVSNLADALKHCATGQYAYVLSDMEIHARPRQGKPRVQNIENLLERLAETSNGECLPIILMTDLTAPDNPLLVKMMRLAANLCERGVCEFIGKPFLSEGRTLDRVIKKILGLNGSRGDGPEKKLVRRPTLRGKHLLGPDCPEKSPGLTSGNGRIVLTRPQADIMTALSAEPGKTMYQVDIIAAAGYGKHATSQHLARLRKLGLIHQPQGPRGGFAIADEGVAYLGQEPDGDDA